MSNIHRHTPTLDVIDSRGIRVRQVKYLRNDPLQSSQACITRSLYDVSLQIIKHYALFDKNSAASTADGKQINSLSGAILLTQSTDAGWTVNLLGEAGQPVERWDGRGTHWQFEYDNQLRATGVFEQQGTGERLAVERFEYASNSPDHAQHNQCGRLIRHNDTAGCRTLAGHDLNGNLTGETRRFLKQQHAVGWPEAEDQQNDLLESGAGFTTSWEYAWTGELLMQKDARGNAQHRAYDEAGQLKCITLEMPDVLEHKVVLDQIVYNEQGQITSQQLGGKISHQTTYLPANGRVRDRKISRADARQFQSMRLDYDPVGNLLSVTDRSKTAKHNANQRVLPVSTYQYDSLNQLTQATGREEARAGVRVRLPTWSPHTPDPGRLLNFTQQYSYDNRGNLIKLQHQREGNNYTREMHVATGSNRALRRKSGGAIPDHAEGFDANGNQLTLSAGQPMEWNNRNQLQRVALIERATADADEETYLYDASGQRLRKRQRHAARATTHLHEVLYLPGLEVRTNAKENLDVINIDAGDCQARCMVWTRGRPDGIVDKALRYTFDDHAASTTLEFDADAKLISEEGYYPFGNTAWRAARNVIEARYRRVRYSGKERDASGLYYYGSRYYAPWLQRWVSADPAGWVDGFNLYGFVANNPLKYKDRRGLMKYEIEPFSSQPSVAAPTITRAAAGHQSSSGYLDVSVLEDYRLAYDVIWTTRSLLSHGPGNQIGAISNSLERSDQLSRSLRANIGPSPQSRAQHAVAAATGLCDEFAAVSASLLSSSARNASLSPVHLSGFPGHSFTLLGDPMNDPLVIDPWVTFAMPHRLSESRYAPITSRLNVSPRMPQDPAYAMPIANVAALAPLYGQQPAQNPTFIVDLFAESVATGNPSTGVWNQMTSQQQSMDVHFSDGNTFYNFAEVPQNQFNQIRLETQLANDFANLFPPNYFRRF